MPGEGRPFEEGSAGGPGRPSFRDLIDKVGSEIVEVEGIGKCTKSEKLVRGAFELAETGEENTRVAALKFIATHRDGAKNINENTGTQTVTVVFEAETPMATIDAILASE